MAIEERTPAELCQHYEVEKELAGRLRHAPREERSTLYPAIYDELYCRVPNHPQLMHKNAPRRVREATMRLLRRQLKPSSVFLEVGAGDCALSRAVAPMVSRVYALEVSAEVSRHADAPPNFSLILSKGCDIPLPEASVDVAYSDQVMEHIHPDDALEQLGNIYRVLKPGGVYLCITPNRINGPHDISRYFDTVATGLHLKEYSIRELSGMFRQAGFRSVRLERNLKFAYAACPVWPFSIIESALEALPPRWTQRIARIGWVSRGLYPVMAAGK